ncbi:MAG: Hsp33 family molecular chaperone HslO [Clostridiales bacterium]|jgi:molecular chaperone Hsp33|nr:Hsp33 family molecular chaperone HslO [Clostridiales bacterium]
MARASKHLLNDSIVVTVVDSASIYRESNRIHGLSAVGAAVLNRLLTFGIFLSQDLKDERGRLSLTLKGAFGNAVAAARAGGEVKGYLDVTDKERLDIPLSGDRADVAGAVGRVGSISVIKDFGLKEPYTGHCELVSGDLAGDFSLYLTVSEQKPSAVALGEYYEDGELKAAGGVFVQPLPNTDDFLITIVQDILRSFTDTGKILFDTKTTDGLIETYFGDFKVKKLEEYEPAYRCRCDETIEDVVRAMGRGEAVSTIIEQGKIEAVCSFCDRVYTFGAEDVIRIFKVES